MANSSLTSTLPRSAFSRAKAPTLRHLTTLLPIWPPSRPTSLLHPLPEPSSYTTPSAHSLAQLSSQFDSTFGPTARAPLTRRSYSKAWNTFVTFCAQFSSLSSAIPANIQTLKAYTQFLLSLHYAPSTIRLHLAAIIHRHTYEN